MLREEALVRNVVVVLLEDLLARVPHAACDQVQALRFEPADDFAREAALDAIGFDLAVALAVARRWKWSRSRGARGCCTWQRGGARHRHRWLAVARPLTMMNVRSMSAAIETAERGWARRVGDGRRADGMNAEAAPNNAARKSVRVAMAARGPSEGHLKGSAFLLSGWQAREGPTQKRAAWRFVRSGGAHGSTPRTHAADRTRAAHVKRASPADRMTTCWPGSKSRACHGWQLSDRPTNSLGTTDLSIQLGRQHTEQTRVLRSRAPSFR